MAFCLAYYRLYALCISLRGNSNEKITYMPSFPLRFYSHETFAICFHSRRCLSGDAQISFLCLFLRRFLFRRNDNDFSFRTRLCHELSRSFRQSRGWPMLPGIDHFSDERAHCRPDIRRSGLPAATVLRPVRPSLTFARRCCGGGGLHIPPSGHL